MLGGNIVATTFYDTFNIKVPPNTPNGKVFKLSNQGMPVYGDEFGRGTLFVKLVVVLPDQITDREKELFQQLQNLRK